MATWRNYVKIVHLYLIYRLVTKLSEIPRQAKSDPHERRNDLGAVSAIDSVKS